jgi:transcriptional regulator with XRE-family HTH domain
MINTNKLKGRIVEKGMTQKDLAHMLSLSVSTVSKKLNGESQMTLSEAEEIAKLLEIDNSQFGIYFFAQ